MFNPFRKRILDQEYLPVFQQAVSQVVGLVEHVMRDDGLEQTDRRARDLEKAGAALAGVCPATKRYRAVHKAFVRAVQAQVDFQLGMVQLERDWGHHTAADFDYYGGPGLRQLHYVERLKNASQAAWNRLSSRLRDLRADELHRLFGDEASGQVALLFGFELWPEERRVPMRVSRENEPHTSPPADTERDAEFRTLPSTDAEYERLRRLGMTEEAARHQAGPD